MEPSNYEGTTDGDVPVFQLAKVPMRVFFTRFVDKLDNNSFNMEVTSSNERIKLLVDAIDNIRKLSIECGYDIEEDKIVNGDSK